MVPDVKEVLATDRLCLCIDDVTTAFSAAELHM